MTDRWEAPAKLNLSLRIRSRDRSGYHPLRSLVQTVEFTDRLDVATGEDHRLVIEGADLDPGRDNLVWKAVEALVGRPDRPRMEMVLHKAIPAAAGLGGGSSDAAAALRAAARVYAVPGERVVEVAPSVGSDVAFFLSGGSAWMEGRGERLTEVEAFSGFAVAIAVPDIHLATPDVYRAWDELDEPCAGGLSGRDLPPPLRGYDSLANDLLPAALHLAPELGDFMAAVSEAWGRPVAMSGSGPALFGYFADLDEAEDAARSLGEPTRAAVGAGLRQGGVRRIEE